MTIVSHKWKQTKISVVPIYFRCGISIAQKESNQDPPWCQSPLRVSCTRGALYGHSRRCQPRFLCSLRWQSRSSAATCSRRQGRTGSHRRWCSCGRGRRGRNVPGRTKAFRWRTGTGTFEGPFEERRNCIRNCSHSQGFIKSWNNKSSRVDFENVYIFRSVWNDSDPQTIDTNLHQKLVGVGSIDYRCDDKKKKTLELGWHLGIIA